MAENPNPNTICIRGKIGNKEFTVLVDGGSTHNFILREISVSTF